MQCSQCSNHVTECSCPDKAERLSALGSMPHVAVKWCRRCDRHYALCDCSEPAFAMKSNGELFDLPEEAR